LVSISKIRILRLEIVSLSRIRANEITWNEVQTIHEIIKETCLPHGTMPFSPAGAPIKAKVKGSKVDWPMVNGSASPSPAMNWVSEEVEELTLIPYGCTNLRLTEMTNLF
jgi:hypothetical protein